MATVEEINKAFAEKGVHIELPIDGSFEVKKVDILEKKSIPGMVGVLLNVVFINERGRQVKDLFYCEGTVTREKKKEDPKIREPLKDRFLPGRKVWAFDNREEARAYVQEALTHLLQDKGYEPRKSHGADAYFEKRGRGIFLNFVVCCNQEALKGASELVEMRRKHGASADYGLVVLAFQESLGVPLRKQEIWISRNVEFLSSHRIGVYAVDNKDPNRVYSFTIYPRARELIQYFVVTTPQWSLVRSRYVANRGKQEKT
ncbi:MAG: hypothetical protein V2J25_13890 [Desulfatiglans sp.]|nr:hypothetical protein [Desulfatiglans sp.]